MLDEPFDPDPAITRWFGQPWPSLDHPAPICEDTRYRIDPPVDETCVGCSELILPDESGIRTPMMGIKGRSFAYQHAECILRSLLCPEDVGLGDGTHSHKFEHWRAEGRMLMEWRRSAPSPRVPPGREEPVP